MKNIFNKGLAAVAILAGGMMLGSCSSDFLDTVPGNKVSTGNVWTSKNMANAVVTGAYERFEWEHNGDMGRYKWDNWCEIMDEDVNWTGDCQFKMGSATATSDIFKNVWKMTYEEIYRTSNVIVNLDQVPDMSDDEKARDIAEMKVLRAWAYYRANCFYRGIPIYTEPVEYGKADKGRNTVDEVWAQVIQDCTEAINCPQLPAKYATSDGDYGRMTKGAAYFLRAQVYLWQKKWQEAVNDFEALKTCGYKLFYVENTDAENAQFGYNLSYKKMFKQANEKNDEFIFQYQYTGDSGLGNKYSATYGNRVTVGNAWNNHLVNPYFIETYTYANGKPFNWNDVIPGYNEMDVKARSVFFLRDHLSKNPTAADDAATANQSQAKYEQMANYGSDMSKYLVEGNEERILQAYNGRDPRLLMSVITPYSEYIGGCTGTAVTYTLRWPYIGSDAAFPYDVRTDTNDRYYYLIRKWVHEGREWNQWGDSPIDIPQFRYAEALIGLAEAYNELGNTDKAVEALNQVRERAGVAKLNSNEWTMVKDQADLRERIQNEYKWELAFENKVYFHELRWGANLPQITVTADIPVNGEHKTVTGTHWRAKTFAGGNGMTEMWGVHRYTLNEPPASLGDVWAIPDEECQRNPNLVQNNGWK